VHEDSSEELKLDETLLPKSVIFLESPDEVLKERVK